jgi:hypothetical protein
LDSISVALEAVKVQQWLANAAFLSIFLVLILIAVFWWRFTRDKPRWQRVSLAASGCMGWLLYAVIAFVFSVCGGGQVGEFGKARLARAYAQPVVDALARYRTANGVYPDHLSELVPSHLNSDELRAPELGPLGYPFVYVRDSLTYELTVPYLGPGINSCGYRPGSDWECGGHF